jgi:hypothetical protein
MSLSKYLFKIAYKIRKKLKGTLWRRDIWSAKKEAYFRVAILMYACRGVHPFGIFTHFANKALQLGLYNSDTRIFIYDLSQGLSRIQIIQQRIIWIWKCNELASMCIEML